MRRAAWCLGLWLTVLTTAQPVERLELLELRELALGDALPLFNQLTGLKVVASAQARQTIVSLYLADVVPLEALEALCKAHGLWFSRDATSGVVLVRTASEYRRDIDSLGREQTRVVTLLYPNALLVALAIGDLYGDRVEISTGGAEDDAVSEDLERRFDRFELIDRQSQGLGIFDGSSAASGGGSRSSDSATSVRSSTVRTTRRESRSSELRNDTDAANNNLRGLTAEQIQAIESADPGVLERLLRGRAAIYVTVIRAQNQLIVRTADEGSLAQIEALIAQLDVPVPMVLLEVKILSLELSDTFSSVFDLQWTDRGTMSGGFTTGDILPPASDDLVVSAARKQASLALGGTGLRSGDLTFQVVNDSFRARLQLLENDNRVTVLATPMLLTANNEVSRLFIGEERPLNRGFTGPQTIVDAGGQVVTTPGSTTIEFRPVGTTLLFTPTINADRTVTIRVIQENSDISPAPARVLVPSSTGFIEQLVDVVRARTISGTVVAKDGLALALGGLIEEELIDSKAVVPVLGRLPILGFFFQRKRQERTRRELVIVLRPYVLATPHESAQRARSWLDEHSLHPTAPEGTGTLGTFGKDESLVSPRGRALLRRLQLQGTGRGLR